MLKTVVCPGSFDPVTNGHLDIIRRSAKLFENVVVVVMRNRNKNIGSFTVEERVDFLERCTGNLKNVKIDKYDGLLTEYAKIINADAVVKGLRAVSDFDDEFRQALANQKLNPNLETIFFTTSAEHMFLSSSVVRQVCELGGDISAFVPPQIREDIIKRLSKTRSV
ncbi:MAG TPA: pantetheine-phosphate adenylyltransferase [Oscillospiraceae bacterium]|nr:pantetheine-phosphate adenylyltransferase [Oscillospiraceae bacterium]